jgi:hypothetical protein
MDTDKETEKDIDNDALPTKTRGPADENIAP